MKTTNLTIIEAIQSGLPFKLPEHGEWHDPDGYVRIQLLTRNDWEIKVPEVTITRKKLAEAWDVPYEDEICYHHSSKSEKFKQLCKNLGL